MASPKKQKPWTVKTKTGKTGPRFETRSLAREYAWSKGIPLARVGYA